MGCSPFLHALSISVAEKCNATTRHVTRPTNNSSPESHHVPQRPNKGSSSVQRLSHSRATWLTTTNTRQVAIQQKKSLESPHPAPTPIPILLRPSSLLSRRGPREDVPRWSGFGGGVGRPYDLQGIHSQGTRVPGGGRRPQRRATTLPSARRFPLYQ
jgi:hypothetical protein